MGVYIRYKFSVSNKIIFKFEKWKKRVNLKYILEI